MLLEYRLKTTDEIKNGKEPCFEKVKGYETEAIKTVRDVMKFCRDELKLQDLEYEKSYVFVGAEDEFALFYRLGKSDTSEVHVPIEDAVLPFALPVVSKVVYVHNHPLSDGGYNISASEDDIRTARYLKEIGKERCEGSYIFADDIYIDIEEYAKAYPNIIELEEPVYHQV